MENETIEVEGSGDDVIVIRCSQSTSGDVTSADADDQSEDVSDAPRHLPELPQRTRTSHDSNR